MSRFARAWQLLNEKTIGRSSYWSIALQNLTIYKDTAPLIRKYVQGRTLDIGAGKLAWRPILKRYSTVYVSGDLTREHSDLDLLFDATKPLPFAEETFDTLFCHSVLEHTREPWQVFVEMSKVLTPGGVAIVSVPFVFYLHGQPHDYYRFTGNGLSHLAQRTGLEVVDIVASGGLFSFLLNVPSIALSSLLAMLHLYGWIPRMTRFWFGTAHWLARHLERNTLFAMNYIAVVQKVKRVENRDTPSA